MKRRRVQCSCGQEIGEGNRRHLESILHQRAGEIRQMLDKNCNTFSEIGRAVGVTRERVRQMASLLGYVPGQTRRRFCRVNKIIQNSFVAPFYDQLKALGLSVKAFSIKTAHRSSRRRFVVNGRLCFFGRAYTNRGPSRRYITIMGPGRTDFEFAILRYDGGFFVFPKEKIGRGRQHTILPPEIMRRGPGSKSASHDWNDYWNAWHLLKDAPRG